MKTTTLTFTEPELEVISGVLDAGVRAVGMKAVRPLAPIIAKMEAAVFAESVPNTPEDEETE